MGNCYQQYRLDSKGEGLVLVPPTHPKWCPGSCCLQCLQHWSDTLYNSQFDRVCWNIDLILSFNLLAQADEFVVYSPHQQRMRYLVEFTLPDEDTAPSEGGESGEGVSGEPGEEEEQEETTDEGVWM